MFVRVTDGKVHDVNLLDQIAPEPGAFYVLDRGYLDFERLYRLTQAAAFFVTRAKDNVLLQRRYSYRVDTATAYLPVSTRFYRSPASRLSSEPPFYGSSRQLIPERSRHHFL